jgi:hypothetical protein
MKNEKMTIEDEVKALDMLDKARKMLEKMAGQQQQVPAVRQDAPVAQIKPAADKEVSGRVDFKNYIKPGEAKEVLDVAMYTAALATVPAENGEIPLLPGFYYGRGGKPMRDKIRDVKTRREAYDEILARQCIDLELCAQACMAYLSSLNGVQLMKEVVDSGSPFNTVMALLIRINTEQRNVMMTDAKLRNVPVHHLNIGNASQVIFAPPREGDDDKRSSQGNTLTKAFEGSEDADVS